MKAYFLNFWRCCAVQNIADHLKVAMDHISAEALSDQRSLYKSASAFAQHSP